MKIERLPKEKLTITQYDNLIEGELYECVASYRNAYNGWILFAVDLRTPDHADVVFGYWVGEGASIFSECTVGYEDFRFKKFNAKLVEVKE